MREASVVVISTLVFTGIGFYVSERLTQSYKARSPAVAVSAAMRVVGDRTSQLASLFRDVAMFVVRIPHSPPRLARRPRAQDRRQQLLLSVSHAIYGGTRGG